MDRTAAFGPLRTARFARTDGRSDWKASDERQKYQTRLPFGPIVGDPQIEVDIHPPSPMPGNIQNAIPSGVMPYALCTAFSESREYAQLQAQYHDGTMERSQLAQTSRRTLQAVAAVDRREGDRAQDLLGRPAGRRGAVPVLQPRRGRLRSHRQLDPGPVHGRVPRQLVADHRPAAHGRAADSNSSKSPNPQPPCPTPSAASVCPRSSIRA